MAGRQRPRLLNTGTAKFHSSRHATCRPASFYVQDTDKHVTDFGLSSARVSFTRLTPFSSRHAARLKVALPSVPMAMNGRVACYALLGKPGIPQRFLFLMTLHQVEYLKTNTGGATFDTIVVDTFRRMDVVKPAREIVAHLRSPD